ncbi:MAG: thioredoxin domain-containing protein [Candidatus Omnitrophica bacterium]|nr:thioredoxin domain-containing protein [Candidatus Omnitrophota bacterium]
MPKLINFFLSLLGLAVTVKLAAVHTALMRGELTGGAACGSGTGVLDCHAVALSPWASFLGFPLAYWGILGYAAALVLSIVSLQFKASAEKALLCLAALAAFSVAVDLYLFFVMWRQIHRLCLLCLATYGVNAALLLGSAVAWGKSPREFLKSLPGSLAAFFPGPEKPVAWFFFGVTATVAAGIFSFYILLSQFNQKELRRQVADFVQKTPAVETRPGDSPTRGGRTPALRVVEFSDFLCPACQKASRFNEVMLGAYADRVAFTFKHFPMSVDCNPAVKENSHPAACRTAEAAACAGEQGKFWEFHDRVYQKGPEYKIEALPEDIRAVGLDGRKFEECLAGGRGKKIVQNDVEEGARLNIRQTPTYLLNGIYVEGTMTPPVFEAFFQAIGEKSKKGGPKTP